MGQLLKNGKVRRGMLGVNIQDVTSDLATNLEMDKATGVIVSNVQSGSAAETAGIKTGDVIVKINDEKVEDGNFLRNKVAGTKPETEVTLSIIRDNKEQDVKVTLGEFKVKGAETASSNGSEDGNAKPEKDGKLGLNLQPLTPELGKRLNIPEEIKGILITDVEAGSVADEKGIRKGDVIVEINRQLVSSLEDVRSAINKSGDKSALLLISRGGQTLFVTVKPKS